MDVVGKSNPTQQSINDFALYPLERLKRIICIARAAIFLLMWHMPVEIIGILGQLQKQIDRLIKRSR